MSVTSARAQAKQLTVTKLEALLRKAAAAYYHGAAPLLTDSEFDVMKDILAERSPSSKFLAKVGAPVSKGRVQLPFPMMSMDKVKPGETQLARWSTKYAGPFWASDKLDGTSCMIVADGKGLVKLYSRGDQRGGQDISRLVGHILPQVTAWRLSAAVAIRGEIVMNKQKFREKYSSFANPRGLTNGLVNRKIVDKSIANDTDFVAYEVVSPRLPKSQQWELLASLGLKVVHHASLKDAGEDTLVALYTERRAASQYDIDGIIIEDEGPHPLAADRNPAYAFAFKMNLEEQGRETRVVDVVWEASKDSKLIPRVQYEPVNVDGTVLQWATGFNARYIVDSKIGPGALIRVVRSGDVIPRILHVVKPAKPKLPDATFHWDATGVHLVLDAGPSVQGDLVNIKLLTRFFTELRIDNLKEGLVTRFYEHGLRSIRDYLRADIETMTRLPGVNHTLANKLVGNIQHNIKDVELGRLMTATNIFGTGIGDRKLKALLQAVPDLLQCESGPVLFRRICDVEGFQAKTAEKIVDNLPTFKRFLDEHPEITVAARVGIPQPVQQGPFANQVVVFTGFRDQEWEAATEAGGGKVATSVSAKTTLVVAKEPAKITGKVAKAQELGIVVVGMPEFAALLH